VQEEGEETATAKRLPGNARGLQTGKRQKKQPHSKTLARVLRRCGEAFGLRLSFLALFRSTPRDPHVAGSESVDSSHA